MLSCLKFSPLKIVKKQSVSPQFYQNLASLERVIYLPKCVNISGLLIMIITFVFCILLKIEGHKQIHLKEFLPN